MQPNTPFLPWAWRDPEGLAAFYPPGAVPAERYGGGELSGYRVEATDGRAGSIDEATADVGQDWLVVDTGPTLRHRVLLPAEAVREVDHAEHKVYVDRTKHEVERAPDYARR